ncbi:hypothetical protein BJX61DRAFT_501080 [Aspergillus egyptiacus]|nr:hypothetical protein BJX61DRAFT_501080 [Aspergillus egyptiacus]
MSQETGFSMRLEEIRILKGRESGPAEDLLSRRPRRRGKVCNERPLGENLGEIERKIALSRVRLLTGPGGGWTTFLVSVASSMGLTGALHDRKQMSTVIITNRQRLGGLKRGNCRLLCI